MQVGWENTKPEKCEHTRIEMQGATLAVRPLDPLVDHWEALGLFQTTFDGPAAFSWTEMQAMRDLSRLDLPPICWETLRCMSVAYTEGWRDRRPLSKPPVERF